MTPVTKARKNKDGQGLSSPTNGSGGSLDKLLQNYLDDFVARNRAAKVLTAGLKVVGVGLWPVIDHLVFRTLDAKRRAKEFEAWGYRLDSRPQKLVSGFDKGRVYRKLGYPSLLLIEPAKGAKDRRSLIPEWVRTFGENQLYSLVIRAQDADLADFYLEKQGIPFTDKILGNREMGLRLAVAKPEMKEGKAAGVLAFIERQCGQTGFLLF